MTGKYVANTTLALVSSNCEDIEVFLKDKTLVADFFWGCIDKYVEIADSLFVPL